MRTNRRTLLAADLWLDGPRLSLRRSVGKDLESVTRRGVRGWGSGVSENRDKWCRYLTPILDPRPPASISAYAAFGKGVGVTVVFSALCCAFRVSWKPIANTNPRTLKPSTTTMP